MSKFSEFRTNIAPLKITYKTNADLVFPAEGSQEITERVIIPVEVPYDNIKAIDVTDLSEEERSNLTELMKGYKDYLAQQKKNTFSSEDYVEHTTGKYVSLKWRTFKKNGIELGHGHQTPGSTTTS